MDDIEYLQPDFDPKNLKVAELRNVLMKHEIFYKSSAKKTELVEIFNRELKPISEDLLKLTNSVTADGTGIINIPKKSSKDEVEEEDDEEIEIKPKKKKSKDSEKKSKRKTLDDSEEVVLEKKKTKKLLKVKQPPQTDEEDEEADTTEETHFSNRNVFQRASLSPKSSKKSTPIKTKLETSFKHESESEESSFTTPQQVIPKKRRGGKGEQASADGEDEPQRKRKIKSPKPKLDKTPVKSKSKKIEKAKLDESVSIIDDSFKSLATPNDSSKFEDATPGSVSRLKDFIAVSPEFAKNLGKKIISSPLLLLLRKPEFASTPKGPKRPLGFVDKVEEEEVKMEIITPSITDEEEELKRLQDEMSIHMEKSIEKVEKVQDELDTEEASIIVESAFKNLFIKLMSGIFFAFFIVVSLVFAIWYLDQKQKIGYCGNEVYERTFKVENYDEFDFEGYLGNSFAPQCAECPQHGTCDSYLQLSCDEDYIVSYPWYSFGGLLPIAGDCVPDRAKQQKIDDMVNYTLEILRIRNAENCGKESDEKVGLSSNEIYDLLKGSEENLPDTLWEKVINELENEPEITLRFKKSINQQDETSTIDEEVEAKDKIFRSSSRAKFSIKCRFQEIIYHQLVRFKYLIIGVISVIIISILSKFKYENYMKNKEKIDKLSSLIVKKLVQQNKLASKDNTGLTRDYLALVQLRDILIDDLNRHKSVLWNQVIKRISKNSNIEERTIEVGGEIIKIWKWIGVDIDEDEL